MRPEPTLNRLQATPVALKANATTTVAGKLDGGPQIDLEWASNSQVACFPETMNEYFRGAHKLYAIDLPPDSEVNITVTPNDPKLDISLYGYTKGANDTTSLPPNVTHATSCEASNGTQLLSQPYNPGKPESIRLFSGNPYRAYIGVAGVKDTRSGAFTLRIHLKTPPPPPTGKVRHATPIEVKVGATTTINGKLDGGPQIDLAWASSSQVACFPETMNEYYRGAHKVYTFDLPRNTDATITVTPLDTKLDISLYGYTVGPNDTTSLPPNVPRASCEASHGTQLLNTPYNPGRPESIELSSWHPYRAYIGVAGVKGTRTGAFKLSVSLKSNEK